MYYVTKYALTQGIWEVPDTDAEVHDGYLYVGVMRHAPTQITRKDWFTNKADAVVRFNELVAARKKALKAELKKLEDLRPKFVAH